MTEVTERHPLDQFAQDAQSDLARAMQLWFWKERFENRDFTFQIEQKDIEAFEACVDYLSVRPQIRVFRPQGVPAREAVPASGKRPGIGARPAIPPKDYVVVQMVDSDGNAFAPIENNEADRERQLQTDKIKRVKEQAAVVANALALDLSTQTFSTSTIQDAIQALRTVAAT